MRAPSPRRELVTKGDLEANTKKLATWIEERFATKTDLERFATKADLERFATKADLERFATKEELAAKASKDDLARTTKALMVGIENVRSESNEKIDRLRAEMKAEFAQRPTHDDLGRAVNTIIESIGAQIRALDDKYTDLPARVDRLEAADLPARVARLEAARRRR